MLARLKKLLPKPIKKYLGYIYHGPQLAVDALYRLGILKPGYNLAIGAIMFNEAPYVEEWLEYHQLLGFEHFYIYDNGSTDDLHEKLRPYIEEGIVTYVYYPGHAKQHSAYNDIIARHKYHCRYLAIIDADEFIRCPTGDIFTIIDDIMRKRYSIGEVCLRWLRFGSSGHLKKPDGLVIENYIRREAHYCEYVKSICNPRKVASCNNPHIMICLPNMEVVDLRGIAIKGTDCENCATEPICINHYVSKSKEECMAKIARGQADGMTNYGQSFFDWMEKTHNAVEDREIQYCLPELKKRLDARKKYQQTGTSHVWMT